MKKTLTIARVIIVKMVAHALMLSMRTAANVHQIMLVNFVKKTLTNVRCDHQFVKMVQHVQIRMAVIRVYALTVGLGPIVV